MKLRLRAIIGGFLVVASLGFPAPGVAAAPESVGAAASGDWPQFHSDPANTGFNPVESAISPENVGNLGLAWTAPTSSWIDSSPAVADGVVYVGSTDGTLYAYAVGCNVGGGSCTPVWRGVTGGPIDSSPAVVDGVVYVGSRDGRLYAYGVGCNTGGAPCQPIWVAPTAAPIFGSSPAVVDGVVYVGSSDGNLYAFQVGCNTGAGPCAPLWKGVTGGSIGSSPAVAGGVVYITSSDGSLYAYAVGCNVAAKACEPLWKATMGSGTNSPPTVADGVVYVGSGDGLGGGLLYAFAVGCNTGGGLCDPIWTGPTGQAIQSSPAVADGAVYVGADDGNLYAFAVDCSPVGGSCEPLCVGQTGGPILSSPAVAGGVVFVGSFDGSLYAYEAGAGSGDRVCRQLWSAATGDQVGSSPAVVNGVVYVGSVDHRLYAFDLAHGDVTPPSITRAPRVGGVPGTLGSGVTEISWSGSDGAGSGIVLYDVQQSKDGGAWTAVVETPARSMRRSLVFGHSYRYRVRAHDRAGIVGLWVAGASFVPTLVQSTSRLVRYPRGTWHTQYIAGASGGATRWSTTLNARARFTFTGRAISWVTATGGGRGSVKVYVDGAYRTTLGLGVASNGTNWKQVLFNASWGSKGTHTIELRSSRAGYRVDVDAFVVYK